MTARLPVTVSSMQTWFYMQAYVKKSSPGSTQLPTSRHLLSPFTATSVTSNKMAGRHGAPRPPMTDVGTETAYRRKDDNRRLRVEIAIRVIASEFTIA